SGLRKVPVGYCQSSFVNPDKGVHYAGYPISDVAYRDPEEVIYLLFNLEFPHPSAYEAFKKELQDRAVVKKEVLDYLATTPKEAHPMQWLTAGLNALDIFTATKDYYEDSMNLIAQLPEVVAAIFRLRSGWGDLIPSEPERGYMENFAHMLGAPEGTDALPELMRVFNVLHFDHGGGNLSTLVGKAVASGQEDVYGSLISAMCALAGPLHGMANQECLNFIKMVLDKVPEPEDHDQLYRFIEEHFNAGGKVYGFGHAVLRKQDPRATVLYEIGDRVALHDKHYRMARALKDVAVEFLEKQPKVADPYPNVDAVSGSVLTACGLRDENYYTVLFGMSRCVGIAAQIVYERTIAREGKGLPIMRPKYIYCGPKR
ncbi:MAG: citrate (Si)-synthase, partial [Fibrobacterales bacterium]